ncbi:repair XRCC1 [Argonauta hians]
MARLVSIKYVVSFTSQDEAHSVQNILKDGCFKKWLSNPKDRTGVMEGVFQLDQACVISYLDIGSHMCSSLEIRVGKSDWPQSRSFEPLIRNISLMTLSDVHLGRNIDHTSMFSAKDFSPATADGVWDRIHVICRQNYRKNLQFGLSFIKIKSKHAVSSSETHRMSEKDVTPKKISNEKIKQHFFKDNPPSVSEHKEEFKAQLLKFSSTVDGGPESVQRLSRNAQMLMAAKENAGKYSPESRYKTNGKTKNTLLFSETAARRQNLTIEEEMDLFISKLKINKKQLHSITIADLRHQFEKKKRRKLSVEERNRFASKITDYINNIFSLKDLHKKEKVLQGEAEQGEGSGKVEAQPSKRIKIQKDMLPGSKTVKIQHTNHNTRNRNSPMSSTASTSIENSSNLQQEGTREDQEGSGQFQLVLDTCEESPTSSNAEKQKLNSTVDNLESSLQNSNKMSPGKLEAIAFKMNSFSSPKTVDPGCIPCPLCGELFPEDVIEMHADVCADSQQFELHYSL